MDAGFDLNLMRLLVALAETRNVTRAARAMHMSQSGFSTALAKLRRQLGDELFVRTTSGMEPTARAQRAIETARAVLDTVRHGILEQPEFDPATSHAEFRLAMQETAELVFLPQLLQHLRRLAPDATVLCEGFADRALQGAMAVLPVPVEPPFFPVQQHWHRAFHQEPRIRAGCGRRSLRFSTISPTAGGSSRPRSTARACA